MNAAKCNNCGDIIESKHVHDFITCSCGQLSVDGGLEYAKRVYNENVGYTELCEYASDRKEQEEC